MSRCTYNYKGKEYSQKEYFDVLRKKEFVSNYKKGIIRTPYLIYDGLPYTIKRDDKNNIVSNELVISKIFTTLRNNNFSVDDSIKIFKKIKDNNLTSDILDDNGEPTIDFFVMEDTSVVAVIPNRDGTITELGTLYQDVFKFNKEIDTIEDIRNDRIANDHYYTIKSEKIRKIFKKAGIPVIITHDYDMSEIATTTIDENKKVIIRINPEKINRDSLLHELGHIFVDILGDDSLQVQNAIIALENTLLWEEVRNIYPDYDESRLGKEVLTYAIGSKATDIFETQQEKNIFLVLIEKIFKQIARLFNKDVDIIEKLAEELLSGTSMKKLKNNLNIGTERQRDAIDDIEELRKIKLNEKTNKYEYKGKEYVRNTDFVNENFSHMKTLEERLMRKARTLYNDRSESNKNLTIEDIYNNLIKINDKYIGEGKVSHYYMQTHFSQLQSEKDDALLGAKRILEDKKKYPLVDPKRFEWLMPTYDDKSRQQIERDKIRNIIASKIGINTFDPYISIGDKDKIEVEVPIVNDRLGIGTTFDIVARKKNGDLVVIDWKSGAARYDEEISRDLKYGENKIGSVPDNATGRAALAFVHRILAYKDLYPDARFSDISLGYLNKKSYVTLDMVNLQANLGILSDYYKENNKELFEELNKKGLFDANNYAGVNVALHSITDSVANLPLEDQVEYYIHKQGDILERIKAKRIKLDQEDPILKKTYRQLLKEYTDIIMGLKQTPGAIFSSADKKDMGFFKRWLGTAIYDNNDTKLKFFSYVFMDQSRKKDRHLDELKRKFQELAKPIVQKYYGHNFLIKEGIIPPNIHKFYSFFFVNKEYISPVDGTTKIGSDFVTPNDPEWDNLNDDQKKLVSFVNDTIQNEYIKTMHVGSYTFGNTTTMKYQALGLPDKLKNGFMPLLPCTFSEFVERNPLGKSLKSLWHRNVCNFFEVQRHDNPEDLYGGQLPLKYVSDEYTDRLKFSGNHTMNVETIFISFMDSLLTKRYLDDVVYLGDSLRAYLQQYEVGNVSKSFKNKADFVFDAVNLLVRNVQKKGFISSEPFKITVKDKVYEISPSKFVQMLRNWTTFTVMAWNVFNAGFNLALITMQNHLEALKGSIAKHLPLGIDPQAIEFRMSTMVKADALWGKLIIDFIFRRQDNNKLYNIAKNFRYLAENYDYKIKRDDLLLSKNKFWNSSMFYCMYKLAEDYGNYTVLAAQLLTMKHLKTGKSLWSCYDNKGRWIGGERGEVNVYTDKKGKVYRKKVGELTTEEIMHLKRTSQRLFGSYRYEERMMLEAYIYGKFALQFKKYLPQILSNLYQGRYDDVSLGYYKLTGNKIIDENGNEVDELKFQTKVSDGRILVMLKFLAAFAGGYKSYQWKNLTDEDKLGIINTVLTSMVVIGGILFFTGSDDDKDKTAFNIRLKKLFLQDVPQGINPLEVLNSLQMTTIGIGRLYKVGEAFTEFMIDGVIAGKRTKRGRYPGETNLWKYLPMLSIVAGWERYLGEDYTKSRVGRLTEEYLHTTPMLAR